MPNQITTYPAIAVTTPSVIVAPSIARGTSDQMWDSSSHRDGDPYFDTTKWVRTLEAAVRQR
jgi:hypothetical protein